MGGGKSAAWCFLLLSLLLRHKKTAEVGTSFGLTYELFEQLGSCGRTLEQLGHPHSGDFGGIDELWWIPTSHDLIWFSYDRSACLAFFLGQSTAGYIQCSTHPCLKLPLLFLQVLWTCRFLLIFFIKAHSLLQAFNFRIILDIVILSNKVLYPKVFCGRWWG